MHRDQAQQVDPVVELLQEIIRKCKIALMLYHQKQQGIERSGMDTVLFPFHSLPINPEGFLQSVPTPMVSGISHPDTMHTAASSTSDDSIDRTPLDLNTNPSDGQQHVTVHRNGKIYYRCICGYETERKNDMTRHRKSRKHSLPQYICACRKAYTRKGALKCHQKRCGGAPR